MPVEGVASPGVVVVVVVAVEFGLARGGRAGSVTMLLLLLLLLLLLRLLLLPLSPPLRSLLRRPVSRTAGSELVPACCCFVAWREGGKGGRRMSDDAHAL